MTRRLRRHSSDPRTQPPRAHVPPARAVHESPASRADELPGASGTRGLGPSPRGPLGRQGSSALTLGEKSRAHGDEHDEQRVREHGAHLALPALHSHPPGGRARQPRKTSEKRLPGLQDPRAAPRLTAREPHFRFRGLAPEGLLRERGVAFADTQPRWGGPRESSTLGG